MESSRRLPVEVLRSSPGEGGESGAVDVKEGEGTAASTNVKSMPVLEAAGAMNSFAKAGVEELVGMLNEAMLGIVNAEGPARPVVTKVCEAKACEPKVCEAEACEAKVCEAAAGVEKTIACRPVISKS